MSSIYAFPASMANNTQTNVNPRLILVGGMPGSGKTTIGSWLAKDKAVFIDKDTASKPFTQSMLKLLGLSIDDRESEAYLSKIRDLEYTTMMDIALENIKLGHDVICSAPFIKEFDDNEWLERLEHEAQLWDAELVLVWVTIDPKQARARIAKRSAGRDTWKMVNWDSYIAKMPLASPSPEALTIDNSTTPGPSLIDQVVDLQSKIWGPKTVDEAHDALDRQLAPALK